MRRWIEDNFTEHLEFLKELAAIPAPSHNEDRRVEFLLGRLKALGVDCYSDEAKNVLVPFFGEAGDDAKDIAVFCAHTDVVFPDTEPLPVREEGGRLYAPGVGDDTANAAAIFTLIRYIKEMGLKPKRPVLFVFNSCEEGLGNLKGTKALMRSFSGRAASFVSFDCPFEGGMIAKAVGSERWRVWVQARGGHSYSAFGNSSAIHRLAVLVAKLYSQSLPELPGERTTYNVGVISGGTSVNTIAQSAEMLYEYRSTDRRGLEYMRQSFRELVENEESEDAHFGFELVGDRPCGSGVDEAAKAELIDRCSRVIESVTGKKPPVGTASTDANIPLSLGIPALTFGLYSGEGEHTREEWLKIESLKPGLEIALRLVADGEFYGE